MMKSDLNQIEEELRKLHEGDEQQLNVILSKENRILVEAPAGYGKTTTVISRLSYLIASDSIPYPKKILALTFSVNAALKIKRDVACKLPALLGISNNPNFVVRKLTITNYHGFCKGVLKKYGYLLNASLKSMDNILAISDDDISTLDDTRTVLHADEKVIITELNDSIKNIRKIETDEIDIYNKIILNKLVPLGKITHNAIILIALELFSKFPEIVKFYRNYYPLVVVDEYQDTNIIAHKLLRTIIGENTKLLFVGDSLQRIYGFIGAYPKIMEKSAQLYGMDTIALNKNYRFRNNPEMLKLDNNIRQNAANFNSPDIVDEATLPYHFEDSQQGEAAWISNKVIMLLSENQSSKIAVLVRGRGGNADIIEAEMKKNGIDYFYALYKDEDEEYIVFHKKCLEIFDKTLQKRNSINRDMLIKFADSIKSIYSKSDSKIHESLVSLLYALADRISIDYGSLDPEDRKLLLRDIFENRQLKQAMEYISSDVILGTVHSAKGLEWDYVLLPDVEKFIFPFFLTCQYCGQKHFGEQNEFRCKLTGTLDSVMGKMLVEELCVFYVAITRARKQAFISSSKERFNANGRRFENSLLGCIASLKGINLLHEDYKK